jgi:hypothetical protein
MVAHDTGGVGRPAHRRVRWQGEARRYAAHTMVIAQVGTGINAAVKEPGWFSVGGPQGELVHGEDGVEFLCGAGFGVEEALGAGAAQGDEGDRGHVGFHSFGDGSEAEGVREADDGPDYRQVVGVLPEIADEAPVDFEDVDGQ